MTNIILTLMAIALALLATVLWLEGQEGVDAATEQALEVRAKMEAQSQELETLVEQL